MLAIERRERIQEFLKERGTVRTTELCTLLHASPATVRNDLNHMAKIGQIRKVHGGASLFEEGQKPSELGLGFQARAAQHEAEKAAIAEIALEYIKTNQCILLDASSTALALARRLARFPKLLVVTHGIYTMLTLKDLPNIDTIMVGGFVRKHSGFIEGTIGTGILQHVHVDVAFVSANGFTIKEGLTDFNLYEVELKRKLLEDCHHIIALVDSSKLEHTSSASFLTTDAIETLLTDEGITQTQRKAYRAAGVQVRVCPALTEH